MAVALQVFNLFLFKNLEVSSHIHAATASEEMKHVAIE
jgi:hypothetical protein